MGDGCERLGGPAIEVRGVGAGEGRDWAAGGGAGLEGGPGGGPLDDVPEEIVLLQPFMRNCFILD